MADIVELSPEAQAFFDQKNCQVELLPTPQAVKRWNALDWPAIGLFHIDLLGSIISGEERCRFLIYLQSPGGTLPTEG